MEINIFRWKELTPEQKSRLINRSETDISQVKDSVAHIISRVQETGDEALRHFTKEFDRVDLGDLPLRVTEEEIENAENSLEAELKDAIDFSVENVRKFHETQKPCGFTWEEIQPGVYAGEKALPIDSAGLYVPRGRGSFPSMVYMLAVPAQTAGVKRIVLTTPPGPDGSVDPACLYAAKICGVTEIFRVGGAQAIGALAYGTESIKKVDKLAGPGSMYVTAAKRLVSQAVDPGMPAGPSESIVLADETADPITVALDLLTEAEHGSDSSALLITPSEKLARAVAKEIPGLWEKLPKQRQKFVADVLSGYGGLIITDTMEEAAELANDLATEHLQIQTADPFATLSLIRHAGEIILGSRTPFSAANYSVGANAVLPTGGKAKTWSAVSVRDFIKYASVIHTTEAGSELLRKPVTTLADYEGFASHSNAYKFRKPQ